MITSFEKIQDYDIFPTMDPRRMRSMIFVKQNAAAFIDLSDQCKNRR